MEALLETFILSNYTFALTGLGLREKFSDYIISTGPVLVLAFTSSAYGMILLKKITCYIHRIVLEIMKLIR